MGWLQRGVHNSIFIECGGDYSELVFDLGHINDTGDSGKELHIYYLDADGEYKETYSYQLKANMPYLKDESCPIYNTQTLKITIDGRYINQYDHYGLVNMYLVK